MRRLAMAMLVLVLALGASAACTDDKPTVAPPRPAPPTGMPKVDYGLSGHDCGTAVLDHGQAMPQAGVDCLRTAAAAGAAAHLVVRQGTEEGDPVFTAYQVVGRESIEVLHDARWDNFGSRKLTRSACRHVPGSASPSLTLADCTEPA